MNQPVSGALGEPEGEIAPATAAPAADRRMLSALVCPVTRGPLTWDPERQELISRTAHLAFPVRGGVPIMIAAEARGVD